MKDVVWLPGAQNDVERLYGFIAKHNVDAADKAIVAILSAAEQLARFPQTGRLWDADTHFREWPVQFGAKGYVIRYRLTEMQIVIVRIWHGLERKTEHD